MNKAIKIIGLTLILASFALLIAFFASLSQGSESIVSAAGEDMHVPILTDTILYWTYILFVLAIVVTLAFAFYKFIKSFISNPGSALKSLIPIILFAGIFVVSYLLGSSEKISIIGYEGNQNEGVWVKLTEMFLYTTYSLMVILVVTIFGARIYTNLK